MAARRASGLDHLRLQRPGGPARLPRPLDLRASRRGDGRVPADRQRRRLVRDRGSGAQPRRVASAATSYLVFVHQDVYLHSLAALEVAAGALAADPSDRPPGRGAAMDASGELVGRIRDRVLLLGEPRERPTDVDSLDEVLFMIPRAPARARAALRGARSSPGTPTRSSTGCASGRSACGSARLDIPLTHNSITVNLDRLDVAYEAVAASYPDAVPVRATCGTVAAPARRRAGCRDPQAAPLALSLAARVAGRACRAAGGRRGSMRARRHPPRHRRGAGQRPELAALRSSTSTADPGSRTSGRARCDLVRDGRPISFSSPSNAPS